MPTFEYKAKSGPQKVVQGVIIADSDQQAIDRIMELGHAPFEIKLQAKPEVAVSPAGKTNKPTQGQIRVPISHVAIFTRQMSDMTDAGIPLLKCLEILMNQKQHPGMLRVIESMYLSVKDGSSLSTALAQHPQTFSSLYINMVKSAELGGFLPQALARLADFIEKDLHMRSQVKGSLLYPAIILGVGFLTMFVLLSFVMPKLTVMFDDFNTALPLPTQIIIGMSNFFSKFWWLILGLLGLGGYYIRRWTHTLDGRLYFERLAFKVPMLREFIQKAETARFARTMATLLENGVTISSALESVETVIDNLILKEEIHAVTEKVKEGSSLTSTLKKSSFFSDTAINLISIGEESGKLEKGLMKLAQMNERETAQMSQNFVTILGPVILVLVVSLVGFVIVSMLLPMFKMNSIIN